ncbi:hypothetical protein ACJX0J_019287, partial [Zea mays]
MNFRAIFTERAAAAAQEAAGGEIPEQFGHGSFHCCWHIVCYSCAFSHTQDNLLSGIEHVSVKKNVELDNPS